jgi:hypothetical protein
MWLSPTRAIRARTTSRSISALDYSGDLLVVFQPACREFREDVV